MTGWYTRPVLFVSDTRASLAFYIDVLAFKRAWAHEQDGEVTVAQVVRDDCELILCLDANRKAPARLFIELEAHEMETFRKEIEQRAIPTEQTWWGYPCIRIEDPDGNELLFPLGDAELPLG